MAARQHAIEIMGLGGMQQWGCSYFASMVADVDAVALKWKDGSGFMMCEEAVEVASGLLVLYMES